MSKQVQSERCRDGRRYWQEFVSRRCLDQRGATLLRQKWSSGQIETRLANMAPWLIGMESYVGAHHLSCKPHSLGLDARA